MKWSSVIPEGPQQWAVLPRGDPYSVLDLSIWKPSLRFVRVYIYITCNLDTKDRNILCIVIYNDNFPSLKHGGLLISNRLWIFANGDLRKTKKSLLWR